MLFRSQGRTVGTVRLTAAAPSTGATVTLSSSNTDVVRVPANVSIPAGSTSANFTVDVPTVETNTNVTVSGTYSGVTKTGTVTVTPTPVEARFTVISRTRGENVCVVDESDGHMDCEFDARGSFGAIASYSWKLRIGSDNYDKTVTQSNVTFSPGCNFLSQGDDNDEHTVQMTVELQVTGKNGSRSSTVSKKVTLVRNDFCRPGSGSSSLSLR